MSIKKLSRIKDGENTVIFQVAGFDPVRCDFSTLSDITKQRLMVHGGNAKVGDSAAGCGGQEAYDAIASTWKNLQEDKWTERVSGGGGDKVSLSSIKNALAGLSEEERNTAIAIFAKLGKKVA